MGDGGRIEVPVSLVRRLIATQFPRWAHLPVEPVAQSGWDHRTFRLGEEMSVRLPSAERYAAQVPKEQQWLPRLAPHLPLSIPEPLAMGAPSEGYPWSWSVRRWIEGRPAKGESIADGPRFARRLGRFLCALQEIDPAGGPPPGPHNFYRGGTLSVYDGEVQEALACLGGSIDVEAAREVWEAATESTWQGDAVWIHGDMAASNLLVRDGALEAVIDFGAMGVGDPSCDLAIAWTFFSGASRRAFGKACRHDEPTWKRARGWVLWKALITLAERQRSGADGAPEARRQLQEVLADPYPPARDR